MANNLALVPIRLKVGIVHKNEWSWWWWRSNWRMAWMCQLVNKMWSSSIGSPSELANRNGLRLGIHSSRRCFIVQSFKHRRSRMRRHERRQSKASNGSISVSQKYQSFSVGLLQHLRPLGIRSFWAPDALRFIQLPQGPLYTQLSFKHVSIPTQRDSVCIEFIQTKSLGSSFLIV